MRTRLTATVLDDKCSSFLGFFGIIERLGDFCYLILIRSSNSSYLSSFRSKKENNLQKIFNRKSGT